MNLGRRQYHLYLKMPHCCLSCSPISPNSCSFTLSIWNWFFGASDTFAVPQGRKALSSLLLELIVSGGQSVFGPTGVAGCLWTVRQPLAASRNTLDIVACDSIEKTKNARPSKNTFEDTMHVKSQREAGKGQPTLCYCSQSYQEIQFCLCSKPTANGCCIHLGHQIKRFNERRQLLTECSQFMHTCWGDSIIFNTECCSCTPAVTQVSFQPQGQTYTSIPTDGTF